MLRYTAKGVLDRSLYSLADDRKTDGTGKLRRRLKSLSNIDVGPGVTYARV